MERPAAADDGKSARRDIACTFGQPQGRLYPISRRRHYSIHRGRGRYAHQAYRVNRADCISASLCSGGCDFPNPVRVGCQLWTMGC